MVLRRLDCILEATKAKVLAELAAPTRMPFEPVRPLAGAFIISADGSFIGENST
jgi:hypothetical protein